MDEYLENYNYLIIALIVFIIGLFIVVILLLSKSSNNINCKSNNDCISGQTCSNGECKNKNGQTCSENNQCLNNYCNLTTLKCDDEPEKVIFKPQPNKPTEILKPSPIRVNPLPKPVKIILPQKPPVKIVLPEQPNQEIITNNQYIPFVEEGSKGYCLVTPDSNYISTDFNSYKRNFLPYKDLIDAIDFSQYIITLNNNGQLRRGDILIEINIKVKITQLASFNGYLFILTKDKKIYYLDNSSYYNNFWNFRSSNEILKDNVDVFGDIIRIGNTIYNDYFIIQNNSSILIFDINGLFRQEKCLPTHKRIYGASLEDYIDIDLNKNIGIITGGNNKVDGQTFIYIKDAVMSYNGDIHVLENDVAEKYGYNEIRLLGWVPYYM